MTISLVMSTGCASGSSPTSTAEPTSEFIAVVGSVVEGPMGADTIDGGGDVYIGLEGATILVRDQDRIVVDKYETGQNGQFTIELAPGSYTLEPLPVAGLPGTPSAIEITMLQGQPTEVLSFRYDTGVR